LASLTKRRNQFAFWSIPCAAKITIAASAATGFSPDSGPLACCLCRPAHNSPVSISNFHLFGIETTTDCHFCFQSVSSTCPPNSKTLSRDIYCSLLTTRRNFETRSLNIGTGAPSSLQRRCPASLPGINTRPERSKGRVVSGAYGRRSPAGGNTLPRRHKLRDFL